MKKKLTTEQIIANAQLTLITEMAIKGASGKLQTMDAMIDWVTAKAIELNKISLGE